jgi:hypothetical protein
MRVRWIVVAAAIGLSILRSAAQHDLEDHPPPPDKIAVPDSGTTLPMGDLGGRPLVEVAINGKGPYRFLIDTGASITVVDQELRNELRLPAPNAHAVMGGDLARVQDLRAGEAAVEGVVVGVGPIARMFAGGGPQGVLSAASFPGCLVILDYPRKWVTIRRGQLPAADSLTTFQYTAEQILPNVPLRIGGRELHVHVDSGAPGGVSLPTQYMKELELDGEAVQAGRARTPAGEFPVWSAKVKGKIELGKYTLDVTQVRFSDVNPVPGPPVGNIGYDVLRRFVVTLDAQNRRVRLEPEGAPAAP